MTQLPVELAKFLATLAGVSTVTAVVGLPIYVVFRFLRAYEQRTALHVEARQLRDRVAELEARLEGLEAENEELAEGQRFTTAVLATRPTRAVSATRSDAT